MQLGGGGGGGEGGGEGGKLPESCHRPGWVERAESRAATTTFWPALVLASWSVFISFWRKFPVKLPTISQVWPQFVDVKTLPSELVVPLATLATAKVQSLAPHASWT